MLSAQGPARRCVGRTWDLGMSVIERAHGRRFWCATILRTSAQNPPFWDKPTLGGDFMAHFSISSPVTVKVFSRDFSQAEGSGGLGFGDVRNWAGAWSSFLVCKDLADLCSIRGQVHPGWRRPRVLYLVGYLTFLRTDV